jgi:hypothetical protein
MQRSSGWTKEKVEELKSAGKIKSYNIPAKNIYNKQVKNIPKPSKAKEWLSWNLPYWCNEMAVTLESEYQFHPERKWRFDYAIPSLKIAIEYEGIFSEKSRHTTFSGYNADTDKYNTAAAMGWRVIRLTAKNYTTILKILNDMLNVA